MQDWIIVKLGDLLTESKLESMLPNSNKRIRVKLNLAGIEKRPGTNDKEGATKYFIRREGQFIYGRQNLHKGAFGIVPPSLDGFESSSDIPSFDVNEICYPEWIFYFLKEGNFYNKLESIAKGVGSKRISPNQLYKLNIALPPKAEQKRILNIINSLEKKTKVIKEEFLYQTNLIEKLKNSLLEEAFKGELTKEWRINNPQVERATLLLEHIKNEKIENNIKQKYNLQESLHSIPKTWNWCCYGHIIINIEAGKSPFCEPQKAGLDQWGVIKMSAISWGKFLDYENKTLPLNIAPFIEKEIKGGDFIMTRANTPELIARSVIVQDNVRDKLLLNDKTLRVKFSKLIDLPFVNFYNNSQIARSYYLTVASGTSDSMKNISRENILNQPIALPPLDEQKIISKKIEQIFEHCHQLKNQIVQSTNDAEHLLDSKLSQFFQNTSLNPNILELSQQRKDETITNITHSDSTLINNNKKQQMELEEILIEHGKMSAINLWKMSRYENNIDAFYSELKRLVETEKKIIESTEKGFLEIAS